MKKSIYLMLICLFVFLLTSFYQNSFLQGLDDALRDFFLHLRNEKLNDVVLLITHLGDAKILGVLCMLGVIFMFIKKDWLNGILLLLSIGVSYGLNTLLKNGFERERPISNHLLNEDGFSFPSGNAMVGTTFYLFSSYLLYRKFQQPWILWAGVILPFLLGLSRIYVGVHYPSDIIAGISIGLILVLLLINISKKGSKSDTHQIERNKNAVI